MEFSRGLLFCAAALADGWLSLARFWLRLSGIGGHRRRESPPSLLSLVLVASFFTTAAEDGRRQPKTAVGVDCVDRQTRGQNVKEAAD